MYKQTLIDAKLKTGESENRGDWEKSTQRAHWYAALFNNNNDNNNSSNNNNNAHKKFIYDC